MLEPEEESVRIKIPNSSNGGIAGIMTSPHNHHIVSQGREPVTRKAALILHGHGGHKNYCYQKILASQLLEQIGVCSLRIDFRGCGDSEDCNSKSGRTIDQDVEDIGYCIDYLTSGSFRGIHFKVSCIVGHSRGALAMFQWAIREKRDFGAVVPQLVNCAGRFEGKNLKLRLEKKHPQWYQDKGFAVVAYRKGSYKEMWIPLEESQSIINQDSSGLGSLKVSVLSIYGLSDDVIPLQDAASFANVLGPYHQLELIEHADHNYYGTQVLTDETNSTGFPLKSGGRANYNYCVSDKIVKWLQSKNEVDRVYRYTYYVEKKCRWKHIEGVSNFRDIGGWKISSNAIVRPDMMFRCANPSKITTRGRESIADLKIAAIFDLRSREEIHRDGVLNLPGAIYRHVSVIQDIDLSPDHQVHYRSLLTSWASYAKVYKEVLKLGTAAFRQVLTFARDHPGKPFLFHCTAGKDRTGVVAMIILLLLGVDENTVADEYSLTTIGLKPDYGDIRQKFLARLDRMRAAMSREEVDRLESETRQGRANWSLEKDGFANLTSSRKEAMLATIDILNQYFGGVEQYVSHHLGFSREDVCRIRMNLVVEI